MNVAGPLSLLAEITYRCNLGCPYCYNPLNLEAYRDELDVRAWQRVIGEAADLGVMQMHFSGGEPTLRPDDLCDLVATARSRELYTNLITQGTFLDDALLDRLVGVGLDHIQLSVQAAEAGLADSIAAATVHERKLSALERAAKRPIALTLNCVLHRANIDGAVDVIRLAERFGVKRIELANTQYYGWALRNRAALLPTREQVDRAGAAIAAEQKRLAGKIEITYVLADYYEQYPKPCMSGWGRQFMTVAPDGRVLPCPAAASITTLQFENVRSKALAEIWRDSPSFNAYRGTDWMQAPCRTCPRREVDFGGCRCQAFALTGDAGVTDPACSLSPRHSLVEVPAVSAGRDAAMWAPRRWSGAARQG